MTTHIISDMIFFRIVFTAFSEVEYKVEASWKYNVQFYTLSSFINV